MAKDEKPARGATKCTGAGRTVDEARETALTACRINTRGGDCKLYAIGQHLAGNRADANLIEDFPCQSRAPGQVDGKRLRSQETSTAAPSAN